MTSPAHPHTLIWLGAVSLLTILAPMLASGQSFQGRFSGQISGTPAVMQLQQQQTQVSGQIDASGYLYRLQGTLQQGRVTGQLLDPATGGQMPFEMQQQGSGLTLLLYVPGAIQPLSLAFTPTDGEDTAGASPSTPPAPAPQDEHVERDPALVGHWSRTESMTSGQFSGAAQTFMSVLPDGTYRYGDGRFAGGGPGIGGSSSSGDATVGQWRTANRIVYIQEPGSPQWTPYARYYVEGSRLMFTFGDGSREVWHRR